MKAILNNSNAVSTTVNVCRFAIGATAAHWMVVDEWLSLGVAAVCLLLTYLPGQLLRDVNLRAATAVVTALLLAAHILLGMQLQLYETSLLYDKAMHFIGSGAIAVILIAKTQAYCYQTNANLPVKFLLLLVFSGTLAAGTLWEIFEFAVDRSGLFVAQRGLQDTMLDLLANSMGAVLAITLFAGRRLMSRF